MDDSPDSTSPATQPGTLFVVATPIGNLEDLSARAARVLAEADLIAVEDTRMTRRLADVTGPLPRMVVLNEHTEQARVAELINMLAGGATLALVSDAGTPLISDPGFRLVQATHEAGLAVSPVPGPCAAIAALSAAGLPSDRFHFEGFLPARQSARRRRLQALSEMQETLLFYVPARDLPAVLDDMIHVFGAERLASLGRELTKRHETVWRDALAALARRVGEDEDQRRGEAVLVVAGCPEPRTPIALEALVAALAAELPPSRAAKLLSGLSHLSRREAFALIESARSSMETDDLHGR